MDNRRASDPTDVEVEVLAAGEKRECNAEAARGADRKNEQSQAKSNEVRATDLRERVCAHWAGKESLL